MASRNHTQGAKPDVSEQPGSDTPKTCFVIGPIGEPDSPTRRAADFLYKGIIKPALEASPFFYVVKRADEDVSLGSITSALLTDVMTADLAIADMSERNPNAFYELGVRHYTQKPVILMARHINDVPFDQKNQRAIPFSTERWDGLETAKVELRKAVAFLLENPKSASNPVVEAIGYQKREISTDDEGKALNRVIDTVSQLEARLSSVESANKSASKASSEAAFLSVSSLEYPSNAAKVLRSMPTGEFTQILKRRLSGEKNQWWADMKNDLVDPEPNIPPEEDPEPKES